MNGALDEAMEIMKGSLADNSQIEQPYRTIGEIETNSAGDVLNIYVKGILVDFEIRIHDMSPCNTPNYTSTSLSSEKNPVF